MIEGLGETGYHKSTSPAVWWQFDSLPVGLPPGVSPRSAQDVEGAGFICNKNDFEMQAEFDKKPLKVT